MTFAEVLMKARQGGVLRLPDWPPDTVIRMPSDWGTFTNAMIEDFVLMYGSLWSENHVEGNGVSIDWTRTDWEVVEG